SASSCRRRSSPAPTRLLSKRRSRRPDDLVLRQHHGFCAGCGRLPLVGVMVTGTAATNPPLTTPFPQPPPPLRDVPGRNLRLAFRLADGDAQRFPEMAEALVKEKPIVIVVFSEAAAHAAQRATPTIPIIAIAGDFVAEGLGASLAKPGGNITGVSMIEP